MDAGRVEGKLSLKNDFSVVMKTAMEDLTKFAGASSGLVAPALAGIAAGFTALTAVAAVFANEMHKAVEEADKGARSNQQLAAAVKSTGFAAGFSTNELIALADKTEDLTGINRDVVKSAEAILLTFNRVNREVFPQVIKYAADLAARFGGDLTDKTLQLGKALQDPVRGIMTLRRSGVTFTADQSALIKKLIAANDLLGAQGVILGVLKVKFDGAAAAARDSLTGALGSISNRVSKLREELGTGLLPLVKELAEAIDNLAKDPAALDFFRGLGAAIADLAKDVENTVIELAGALELFVKLHPLMAKMLGLGGVAEGMNSLKEFIENIKKLGAASRVQSETKQNVSDLLAQAFGPKTAAGGKAAVEMTKEMIDAAQELSDALRGLRVDAMAPLDKLAGEFVTKGIALAKTFKAAGGAANKGALRDYTDAVNELSKAYELAVIKTRQELFGGGGKGGLGGLQAISFAIQDIVDKVNALDLQRFDLIVGAGGASAAAAAYERMKLEIVQVTQRLGEGRELQAAILEIALKYKGVLDGIADDSQTKINSMWDSWIQSAQVIVGAIGQISEKAGKWLGTMMSVVAAWRQIKVAQQAYNAAKLRGDAAGMSNSKAAEGAASANIWATIILAAIKVFTKIADAKRSEQYRDVANVSASGGTIYTSGGRSSSGANGLNGTIGGQFSKAGTEMANGIKALLQSLQAMTGLFIVGMVSLSVKIRADGKRFVVTIGDQMVGTFTSVTEAMAAAAKAIFSSAKLSGTLSKAMSDMLTRFVAHSAEELLSAADFITRIEREASGKSDLDLFLGSLLANIKNVMSQLKEFGVQANEALRLSGAWGLQKARDSWMQISGQKLTPKQEQEQNIQRAKMLILQLKLWRVELMARLKYLQGLGSATRGEFGGPGGTGGIRGIELNARVQTLKASGAIMKADVALNKSYLQAKAEGVKVIADIYQEEIDIINEIIKGIDKLLSEINISKIRLGGGGGFKDSVNKFADAVKALKEQWKSIAEDFRKSILEVRYGSSTTALAPRNALGEIFKQFMENVKAAKGGNVAAFGQAKDLYAQLVEMAKSFSGGGTGLGFLGLGDTFVDFFKGIEDIASALANGPTPSKLREGKVVFDERLRKVAEASLEVEQRHQQLDRAQQEKIIDIQKASLNVERAILKSVTVTPVFRKAG